MTDGKIRVIVRSRKVAARTVDLTEPVYSASGMVMGSRRNRLVVYEDVLDGAHRKAIEEGEKLSSSLGIDLEIVDRSKSGFLRRVLSNLSGGSSARINVVVCPSVVCAVPSQRLSRSA
ncbi:MAG TPA: hypothetical protein VEH01_04030 [Nitrososphaerales archaeon]|nr:hypothetical protein [Nitrososphaerales archaeon]